jgi:CDP-glycerol glycerophosphotransferase (TagB/SpsB family)
VNERAASTHEVQILFIQLFRLASQQANRNFHALRSQVSKTSSCDERVWILKRRYDACDAGPNQRRTARRSAAVMRVRLERNVSSRPLRARAGLVKRITFRVLQLFVKVIALAYNFSLGAGDYTADERTRTHLADTLRRQLQRPFHQALVL